MKSQRPVILITEPDYFRSVLPALRRIGRVILGSPKRPSVERLVADADAILIRVETQIDERILSRANRLRLIASATTGVNHIDLGAARRRDITVRHLHGTHTTPTAEHAMALMMALARRLVPVQPHMHAGGWDRARWIGRQLSGSTLGIVGLGRIGKTVARLAGAFRMRVIAYDPYVRRGIPDPVRMCRSLSDLFSRSDVISIHATLTDETRGMIDGPCMQKLKRGSLLVNTARGPIVDERALLSALRSGRLAGAAVDVFSTEPLPPESILRRFARTDGRLILTPHLGASTREAVLAAANEMRNVVRNHFAPGTRSVSLRLPRAPRRRGPRSQRLP